jgi:hypothetical protein
MSWVYLLLLMGIVAGFSAKMRAEQQALARWLARDGQRRHLT